MINNTENKNLNYFWNKRDKISFILSLFICFYHASSFSHYPKTLINTEFNALFRMSLLSMAFPLYFIISGATFFRNYDNSKYFEKVKSRIKSLLIPYLIWNTLNMLFNIVTSYTFISNYFVGRGKFELSFSNIFFSIFHHRANGPFWFIFALMIFVLLSPLFDLAVKNRYVGIGIIVGLIILRHFTPLVPQNFILNDDSIIYYLVGAYISKHCFNWFLNKCSKKFGIISLVIFITCTIFKYIIGKSDYKLSPALSVILFVIWGLAMWKGFDCFFTEKQPNPFMKNSFYIYAMHINTQAVFVKLFYLIAPKIPIMAIPNFLIANTLAIVCILLFAKIIKNISPKLNTILSGGR